MGETYSSETSVDFQWTTRCYIPEDRTLHNHRYENLISYIISRAFREANSSVKSVDPICSVEAPGRQPRSLPLKSGPIYIKSITANTIIKRYYIVYRKIIVYRVSLIIRYIEICFNKRYRLLNLPPPWFTVDTDFPLGK
jgi:hypothetical protein